MEKEKNINTQNIKFKKLFETIDKGLFRNMIWYLIKHYEKKS